MEPSAIATVRLEATVRGRVQGVGFRYFVVREARRLDLVGWVANESDGSVKVIAVGDGSAIDTLEEALHGGPPGAIVERVSAVRMLPTGRLGDFGVRSSGHTGD